MKGKVSLYYNRVTIGCVISYILEPHSASSSSIHKKKRQRGKTKKKRKENEMEINERRERWESRRRKQRGRKEKRRGRKEKRRGKKGRKEEEMRERGRKKEKGENGTRGALPSADAFPNTKLGNNITPMKGRLGKNTTPTSRSPTELNHNSQNNPR